jgi:MCP family monocarboxylic acid transporter-like MFS transporter 2
MRVAIYKNKFKSEQISLIFDKGWIGSTAFGVECLFFLPSAICIDLFGSRKVALFGASLSTIGLLTSFFVKEMTVYFLTYGVLFGIGQAFLAESTYQILPHYFDKNLGLANGIMVFGSALVTIGLILASSATLDLIGLHYEFIILATLSFTTIIASTAFKSVLKPNHNKNEKIQVQIRQSFGTDVLKRTEFNLWWISACFAMFGFYITNVTIVCKISKGYNNLSLFHNPYCLFKGSLLTNTVFQFESTMAEHCLCCLQRLQWFVVWALI